MGITMRRTTNAEHMKDTKASARVGMSGNMVVIVGVGDGVGVEGVNL